MTTKYNHGFTALIGKTIASVDETFLNVATLTCTDGTVWEVDTQSEGYGIYSPILTEVTDEQV